MKKQAGFTLIEVMISIALFSIMLIALWHVSRAFHQFVNEEDYRLACIAAHRNFLKITSGREFPPEVHSVPDSLEVTLYNLPYPNTVRVYWMGKMVPPEQYAHKQGTKKISFTQLYKGKEVVINYTIPFLVWDELRTIPKETHKIFLSNTPIEKVLSVKLADNRTLHPFSQYKINLKENSLEFPSNLTGRVVLLSYKGKRFKGLLSGEFASSDLERTVTYPTKWKILKLKVGDGTKWLDLFTIKRS